MGSKSEFGEGNGVREHVRARHGTGAHRLALLLAPLVAAVSVAVSAAAPGVSTTICQSGHHRFTYTGGEQCYSVPDSVSELRVSAVGAPGGAGGSYEGGGSGGAGADGAQVSGVLMVRQGELPTQGETLYVEVGGAGKAGTGSGSGGNGGFNGGARGGSAGPSEPHGGGGGGHRTCVPAP